MNNYLFLQFPSKVWERPGLYPSEPVFVPSPNATKEDDDIVMSVVITPNKVNANIQLAVVSIWYHL